MNHREIAARMSVVDEMLFLFAPKPSKAQKPRPRHVKFLVEKNVCIVRRRTCDHLNDEELDWQYEVCHRPHQADGYEEIGCNVAFPAEVGRRDEVISRIIGMMKVYMFMEKIAAYRTMANPVVHKGLSEGHHQMSRDGSR